MPKKIGADEPALMIQAMQAVGHKSLFKKRPTRNINEKRTGMKKFDIVVVIAGPAGFVSAIRAAQLGQNVAIVKKEYLGGVC